MSSVTYLVLCLFIAIGLIVFLIMKTKLSAFVALTISGLTLGILAGMPFDKIATSFQTGMGNTLGFLATVLGLGTILGKMLEVSGGAQRLAKTLITAFGEKRAHWSMMLVAFICGIPVFFQVGFVLLIPVLFSVAKQTKMSLIKVGIPVVAGLVIVHVLQDSGIGKALAGVLTSIHMNPIILAWIIALIMRFAVGSTTVAMVTAAGIILPIMPNFPGLNPSLLCVAIGTGGVGLSHVNDSGFWIVKEYYGMTVQDTFKTWTACTTIASVVAAMGALLFSMFV
ncbi:SLC13 family permease [Clostridium thailandense]|uniref:GntT/GntP/DsdX family permease n=1 Tax=Clostridium thailandense TaxID=2794346 RepID=UPI003988A507